MITMLLMFTAGLALGAMFDVFRILFERFRLPKWAMPIVDIVYWIVATILVFRLLLGSNEGQVRMFVFIGLCLGVLLYYPLFSKWTIRTVYFLIRTVHGLVRFLNKTIHILVIKPVKGLYRLVIIILGFLMAIAIFLYKIMIQLFYPFWKVLLWLTGPIWRRLKLPSWISSLWKNILHWFKK
ncbi:spore cortex biosynthesis protein YabQ [Paenibacillus larvae]|nr:spore cortex biosynthesis protein YabQ [Paenibacillus larvae]AVG14190.1 Spore protein YabQ [Paenibacillus larvae subsp. larvae DSM 25430]MDR5598966.1 spore cortex biosynthesis protein YabQ [Paenibacillus larvae]